MFKKILSALILFSFLSEGLVVCAKEVEKIPPVPLYKKVLDVPNVMAIETFMFFVYICPILNWMTGIALLDKKQVSAENLYYEYKQDEFIEEFRKNAPKIIEDFENEFNSLKFTDLYSLETNPEDIEYRIKYIKLLKEKNIITEDYYLYSKFDDCIGLYGFLNNINKKNYDFYLSLLEDGFIESLLNSEKITEESSRIRLLNRINKNNFSCFKTLLEEGFIEENYSIFLRDFKNNSDYKFLLEPENRELYLEYSTLFNDKYCSLVDYDFKDNYNSFLLLKEKGFLNDDIKRVLQHNESDIYYYKLEAVREVLSNSTNKNIEKIIEQIDKNNKKRVKKIKKNIEAIEYYVNDISKAIFFQPPYIFPAALQAEREYLKFNNYVKQEEKQKKKAK